MLDHYSWLSTTPWGCLQDLAINITPFQTSELEMRAHVFILRLIFLFSGKETPTKTVIVTEFGHISNHFSWTLRQCLGLIWTRNGEPIH